MFERLVVLAAGSVMARSARAGLIGLICTLGVCIAAISAGPVAAAPVRSLLEQRQSGVVIQEFDISCAAAALATLLTFQHGDPTSEREIAISMMGREEYLAEPLLVRARQGFSLLDMKRFTERQGYIGIGLGRMELDDLLARAPAIVPINARGYPHFVIFRGAMNGRASLADPAFGNRTMPLHQFLDSWIDYPGFGRVAFRVERPGSEATAGQLAPRPADFVTFN